jgi:hypothetical protein
MPPMRSNKETDAERINRLADLFYEEVKDAFADDCANPIISPTVFGFKKASSDEERAEQLLALEIYGAIFELIRRKFSQEIEEVLYGPRNPPIPPGELFKIRKELIAEEYGRAGKPNKAAFARYVANYNMARPVERLGSGSEDEQNIRTYLKKVLRQKKYRDIADRSCELMKGGKYTQLVIPDHFFKKPGRRKSGSTFKKVAPR